jgi:hypothetical protein
MLYCNPELIFDQAHPRACRGRGGVRVRGSGRVRVRTRVSWVLGREVHRARTQSMVWICC